MKSQVNDTVTKKREGNGFHFVQVAIFCRIICVKMIDEKIFENIFAGNIVDYSRYFILKNVGMT